MALVLLHHAVIALLAGGVFTAILLAAQRLVAERMGLFVADQEGVRFGLAVAAGALATLLACAFYIFSPWIAAAPWLQTFLVALCAATGVLLVGRSLDPRFAAIPFAAGVMALATLLLGVWNPGFNLVNFLILSAAGYAALLKVPPAPQAMPATGGLGASLKALGNRLKPAPSVVPKAQGGTVAATGARPKPATAAGGYSLKPKYEASEEPSAPEER